METTTLTSLSSDEHNRQQGRFNPRRLNIARRRRGFTKVTLSQALGVTTRMATAYESGEKEPSSRMLEKISDILGFPSEFFIGPDLDEPPLDASSFRALTNLTARQRDQALSSGALCIALSDWINEHFRLPEPSVPKIRGVDPETAAMAVRTEWGLGERPIRNMIHLLEQHGVRVFSLSLDCREVDAFSFWRGNLPYIFSNTVKSAEHRRMDAAHELGHLVLHWRATPRGRDSEHEADLFASAFLMPRGSVLAESPRGARLSQVLEAKRRWNVSAAGLVYRMHTLGLLSDWQYRTLFIELSREGYRAAEPNGALAESSLVFAKVFQMLREESKTMADMARDLTISLEELRGMLFGLTLTPLEGNTHPAKDSPPQEPPQLRLL